VGLGDHREIGVVGAVEGRRRPDTTATATELAWLLVVPSLIVGLLIVVALGPLLGGLLPQSSVLAWPRTAAEFRPEPIEHARYALALLGPVLLCAAIVVAARLRLRLPASPAVLAVAAQGVMAVVAVACVVVQYDTRFGADYTDVAGTSARTVYFTPATLAAACAIGLAMAAVARAPGRVHRLAGLVRDTPRRRRAAWTLAAIAIGVSLLPAIELEGTLLLAAETTAYHVVFTFDETSAVLDGRYPLVDFAAQYGSLWAYALATSMRVVGTSVGAFTVLATLLSSGALLAVYAVLRRVVASAMAALLLFLPLLATSLYRMNGSSANRYSLATLVSVFPLRLAGPLLLLWLTARHIDGARPRRRWVLFLVAGLVVLNNVEFGLPACAATVAALLWTGASPLRLLGRIALDLCGGFVAALVLVTVLTVAAAGSPPHLGLLVRYADLFADSGFGMLPIVPTIGISTIVFLTYTAAVALATVRAVQGSEDRLLTGLLAWSGIFGFGLGAYYVGRSHPEVLTVMFPAWALSLVLLTIAVLRDTARSARLPGVAGLVCLVGFGVLVCSLAQTPAPWTQIDRLGDTTTERIVDPTAVAFVRQHTRPGEPVAVLTTSGHRLAFLAGVVDVTPYTGLESMPTRGQLGETLRMLRDAGGHVVFVGPSVAAPEAVRAMEHIGFRHIATQPETNMWVLSRP